MTPQLKAKLASWVDQGFISPEQAETIRLHEARAPERPWVLYGIAGVGVTALVTGIISLIAANWQEISPAVKLGCYFSVLLAVGFGFFRHADRPGLARETLLTLFVPFVLAGIGLIAQIYNLHGDGWQALSLWLSITLPAVCLANNWAVVHLWLAALSLASVIWADSDRSLLPSDFARVCAVATLPPLLVGFGHIGERKRWVNPRLRKAALVWGMGAILFVGTPLANVMWGNYQPTLEDDLRFIVLPWAFLLAACVAVWIGPETKREARVTQLGLLVSSGVFLTLPLFLAGYFGSLATSLLGAAGFFVTWVLAVASAASSQRQRWFDFASLVIAVRVVIVYFEVFGSLAMTGVGLIVSGIVILGIAFAWHRYRGQLRQQLGGAT